MNSKTYDDSNIFAKIIRGNAEADVVYENEKVICFKDIFPKTPVHILILPKNKYIDLNDFTLNSDDSEKLAIFEAISQVIKKYNLTDNGYRLITNAGKDGRQEVPHLHFHLLGGKDVGSMLSF